MKVKRLQWAGHVQRVSDERTIKKVHLENPEGKGKAERPKLVWVDYDEMI